MRSSCSCRRCGRTNAPAPIEIYFAVADTVFDAADTLLLCLAAMGAMVKDLKADEFLFRYIDKALQRRGGNGVWQQRGNIREELVPVERLGVGG